MKLKIILLNSILGIFISIFLLITAVQYFSFNEDYLYKNIDKNVPVASEDLQVISNNLADYLENKKDNLIFEITYEGEKREAFNSREIHHMIDVKNIYVQLSYLKLISLLMIIGIIVFNRKKYLFHAMYYSAGLSFGFSVILGIIISINFNKAFIFFHEIAFSNDLWLLDPRTDLLINLLPLSFFINISIHMLLLFIALQSLGIFIIYKIKKCPSGI
jgi:integral membrane protein (TIGR01906 family)